MSAASINIDQVLDAIAEAVAEKLSTRISNARPLQPRLLTVKQAAEYLGCSEASVYHQVKDGKLPVVRRDRRVFLDVRDMDRVIEECKRDHR